MTSRTYYFEPRDLEQMWRETEVLMGFVKRAVMERAGYTTKTIRVVVHVGELR